MLRKKQEGFTLIGKRILPLLLAFVMAWQALPAVTLAAASDVQMPEASVTPGLYRQAQQVVLTAEAGADIYYTTNNLMPDETDTLYTGPVTISEDTNLCAVAVKNGVRSAATTFGYLIRTEEEPEMQFVVMSDPHVGDALSIAGGETNVYELDKARMFKAMEVAKSFTPDPALLVMNGDVIKQNPPAQNFPNKMEDHNAFIRLMKDSMAEAGMSSTPVQVTIGNHDAPNHDVSQMLPYYQNDEVAKDWFPSAYYHKELGGFDFVYLDSNSSASAQQTWLENTMAEIQEKQDKAGKTAPVFVFLHIPVTNSLDERDWCANAWVGNILKNYPQAVVFSGHTHTTISGDRSISQEAGFTAVNDGCMSYVETIEKSGIMAHRADESVQSTCQFPVTQYIAVEVYNDRIELNRIAVNADSGDAKANDYVPKEPFNNCGVIAGDKWVINRADTTEGWKQAFNQTPAQRKAKAAVPEFAENAKPVITGAERTATVTLPQTRQAQKTYYYQIELVNPSGRSLKSMKVWAESFFSPMPKTLTYDIDGLAQGTTYRAKVTAFNEYGAASEPILSDTTHTTPSIPGLKPAALAEESFDTALSAADDTTHAVPYASVWGDGAGSVSFDDKKATFISDNTSTSSDMRIPFQKRPASGSFTPITEEFFVEYDFKLEEADSGLSYLQHTGGGSPNFTGGASKYITYSADRMSWNGKTLYNLDLKNTPATVRIRMGIDEGVPYVHGVWVNGRTLDDSKVTGAAATGWTQIQFNENDNSRTAGKKLISVDNFVVWKSTAGQINDILSEGNDTVTFDQIKGGNSTADQVTKDLTLDALVGTLSPSNLVITGWKSDREDVVAADGTVTQPLYEGGTATVTLTPLLAMVDTFGETGGDYVSAEGSPITVTVPDLGRAPLEVAKTAPVAEQDFTDALTNDNRSTTIIPSTDGYKSGNVMGEAQIDLSSGENGAAKWVANNTGGTTLYLPFQPEKKTVNGDDGSASYSAQALGGEFTYAFDVTWGAALSGSGMNFYLRNGAGTNVARLNMTKTTATYSYYVGKTLTTWATASIPATSTGTTHKVRMVLGTDGETQYLSDLWINDTLVKSGKQMISGFSSPGWTRLAGGPVGNWTKGEYCTIDNISCYRSAADQAAELAAAPEGKITFEQIRGDNSNADSVTHDLALGSGEAGALLTENKLLVMGWKSSKPEVISTGGKVTPSATENTVVELTPVLAIKDTQTDAYVSVDGAVITVTVLKNNAPAFFDADGQAVADLSTAIKSARADVSGFTGEVFVMAALYQDGRLEATWAGDPVTAGTPNAVATVPITLPDELTGRTLRLYVWKAGSYEPLYAPAAVSQ